MDQQNQAAFVAPIVEAVLDIDCDLPSTFEVVRAESGARTAFGAGYPEVRRQHFVSHTLSPQADQPPTHAVHKGLRALRFATPDGKQRCRQILQR